MDFDNRIKAYKFVSYAAVTFSTVAVLSVCVTLPMVYNYIYHVRRQMRSEINYCKELYFDEQINGLCSSYMFEIAAKLS
ncbi:unnamed protein product [Onchocerca flexuosa]|uniref:Col_cuticle_N domain-containing protein n=1 Tax=Onchocerca flexuosa TaxID=387005 RepID=A0A183HNU0_9BILA|nr:unnamed protein product [Onchocerca flexuosa]